MPLITSQVLDQFDDRAVEAGRRRDLHDHVQALPSLAEVLRHVLDVRSPRTVEDVIQATLAVAGEGLVEATLRFESAVGAVEAFLPDARGEQPVARRRRFVEGVTAFDDARRKAGRPADGVHRRVLVQALHFRRGSGRAEDAVDGAGTKALRLRRGDEVAGDAALHLVASDDTGDELLAVATVQFRRRQRRRDHAGAGMGQHAVAVALVVRVHEHAVRQPGAVARRLAAVRQDGSAVRFRLVRKHHADRLAAVRCRCAQEGGDEAVNDRCLELVDHGGWDGVVVEVSNEAR